MSYADKVFIQNCRDILENGVSDEDLDVRPRWEDGTPAHTVKKFGIVNHYDLQKEFPILTLRRQYLKSAVDELLWIWQKHSNNIKDLGSHVWDQWADNHGSIGKAYGYQMSVCYPFKDVTDEGLVKAFPGAKFHKTYDGADRCYDSENDGRTIAWVDSKGTWQMCQIDKVIYDLVNNPASRRILTSLYNFADLDQMALYPCAYSMTFNVTGNKLNGILNQRSQDMLTANGWNVMQYAALLTMVAQATGFIPGELIHVIADCHIYDRHIPMVEELLEKEPFDAPTVTLDPDIRDFYKFTKDSFTVSGYRYHDIEGKIPVAV